MNCKMEKVLNQKNDNYIFPFFWVHGESEETLREYMRAIYESNIRAVCVESRPHPDFCKEKWWKDMDVILDEARKRGMKVWILDDSHFPTGYANGALKEQPDRLCRQSICCRILKLDGRNLRMEREEILHPDAFVKTQVEEYILEKNPRTFDDDRLLALFAARCEGGKVRLGEEEDRIDLRPFLKDHQLEYVLPEGEWKVYALHLSRNQGYHRSYINMMDKNSCRLLLDAVYEPHYQHYKGDFGTTIAGFFSDEPELGNGHIYEMDDPFGTPMDYPWSGELEGALKERLGPDCGYLLTFLWENQGDCDLAARVRYTYMDAVTNLVREDFSQQIGDWCRQRGVQYIGHLIEDDNHHTRTGCSLGHYFRGLAGQDMSGIDDIGGQVFPQGEEISYNNGVFRHRNGEFYHYILGKLASSAAALEPLKHGNSMCEIFGNYGWEEGVRLEKYLADHFLVRGINHFVPHAFSAKEFPDPDCPPHFYAHGHNPQYRHFGCLMAYMNRLCELLGGGRHIAPAAVVYHGEGDWTGKHITMDGIGHVLADGQIEYDIIPQDVFSAREYFRTEIQEGKLKINTQEYRAVIVPYMQYITRPLGRGLKELLDCKVLVIFVGGCPEGYCDGWETDEKDREILDRIRADAVSVEQETLNEKLKEMDIPELVLSPMDNRIRYCHYIHEDKMEIYLFVNEGTKCYRGWAGFGGEGDRKGKTVYEYDPWENRICQAQLQKGKFYLELEPLKSRVLVFDASANGEENIPERPMTDRGALKEMDLSLEWRRSICRSAQYPDFKKERIVSLPDNLAEEEPEFSGFVRYETQWEVPREGRKFFLEVTDAAEGVEVFIDDQSLGIQIVPAFWYELSGISPGIHRIRIEVATTLERAMAAVPDGMGRTKEAKSQSGITGKVRFWRAE